MKMLKMFFRISFFCIILCSLILSFPSISAAEEEQKARDVRIKKCMSCCSEKEKVCLNLNPDTRLCAAELQNCNATCKSEGKTDSDWSECWTQSAP